MYKVFQDRKDAAAELVERLSKMELGNAVVVAVPRGGVPLGYEIAKVLQLPLDIFLSKKIGHPANPEYAIGSVTLEGAFLNDRAAAVDPEYIHRQTEKIQRKLRERYKKFRGIHQPLYLWRKTVILVDDGVATGNTLLAAIESLRKKEPKTIIVAVPVSPPDTAEKLSRAADMLVCTLITDEFYSVGQFYKDFSQVEDTEVIALLAQHDENTLVPL